MGIWEDCGAVGIETVLYKIIFFFSIQCNYDIFSKRKIEDNVSHAI